MSLLKHSIQHIISVRGGMHPWPSRWFAVHTDPARCFTTVQLLRVPVPPEVRETANVDFGCIVCFP